MVSRPTHALETAAVAAVVAAPVAAVTVIRWSIRITPFAARVISMIRTRARLDRELRIKNEEL